MSVLKYKDPATGEVKTVGVPSVDAYSKSESHLFNYTSLRKIILPSKI